MNLKKLTIAQLDDLIVSIFQEFKGRNRSTKLLDNFDDRLVIHLGGLILKQLAKRYSECDAEGKGALDSELNIVYNATWPVFASAFDFKRVLAMTGDELIELMKKRERKPDEINLERGKTLFEIKRDKHLSWPEVVTHVLTNHADWLPDYKGQTITNDDRKRIENMLRHWVRNYTKKSKK
jgi:hypothetical protein